MNAEKIFGENVYVNLDEVIETVYQCRGDVADEEWEKRWFEPLADLPRLEVHEENELKFYYVDPIDDYWIGQRLDNFYYAKWNGKLGFVWSVSRYLPWGEHIVNEDTLWKEHTYPSEPREIPFTEWIVGFMKKYGSEVTDDAISRTATIKRWDEISVRGRTEFDQEIMIAPSVIPQPKEGEWIPCSERLPETDNTNEINEFDVLLVVRPKKHPERTPQVYIGKLRPVEGDDGSGNFWGVKTASCEWTIWGWSYFREPEVLAWMPLPKPWKGADDDERAIEQVEHDALYEPTYNSEDGSM